MLAQNFIPELEMMRPLINGRKEATSVQLEGLFCKLIELREARKRETHQSDVFQQEADVDQVCSELSVVAWEIVGREGVTPDDIRAKAMVVAEYLDEDCGLVETGALSICRHLLSDK